jgi:hypothetical protein
VVDERQQLFWITLLGVGDCKLLIYKAKKASPKEGSVRLRREV